MIHCPKCKSTKVLVVDHLPYVSEWKGPKEGWPQFDSCLHAFFMCKCGHMFLWKLYVTDEEPQSRQIRTISLKIDAPAPVQYPTPLRSIPESWLERVVKWCKMKLGFSQETK